MQRRWRCSAKLVFRATTGRLTPRPCRPGFDRRCRIEVRSASSTAGSHGTGFAGELNLFCQWPGTGHKATREMYETVVVSTVVMHFAFIAYILAGGFLALVATHDVAACSER